MTWLEHITPFELILITTVIFICFGGSPRFRRKRKLIKRRHVEPPARDYSNYVCPVCGEPGYTFTRCYRAGCADGR